MKKVSHWHYASLEDVAEIQTGLSKSTSRQGEFVTMPYLRVANVQDGHFDLSEVKTIEVPKESVERFRVRPNDVILTEGGDFDKLGRGAVWRGQIKDCVHQNHLFVVRPDPKQLDVRFFAYQTQGPRGRAYFQSCSKQSTNLASINSTQLKQFPTALPPLPEQRKIADILSTWDEALETLDALIAAKDHQKQALMQQLLSRSCSHATKGHARPPSRRGLRASDAEERSHQ
jgi:type I restriction enzyme S subunit